MGSRVYDIKKKFEGLSEASKDSQSFGHPLTKSSHSKSSNLPSRKVLENGNNSSRGLIKRSHAFRSDRINRNLSNSDTQCPVLNQNPHNIKSAVLNNITSKQTALSSSTSQISLTGEISPEGLKNCSANISNTHSDENSEGNYIFKDDITSLKNNKSNGLRSQNSSLIKEPLKSTTPLIEKFNNLQHNNTITKFIVDSSTQSLSHKKDSDLSGIEKNSSGCKLNFININDSVPLDKELYQQGDSSLSGTLKKVLKSPLPSGPPPKKPPRTFAHITEKSSSNDKIGKSNKGFSSDDINVDVGSCSDSHPVTKPIRSKTESQIMLKKLEIALINHKTQGKIIEPKSEHKFSSTESEQVIKPTDSHPVSSKSSNSNYIIEKSLPSSLIHKISPETPSVVECTTDRGCFGVFSCSNSTDLFKSSHIYDIPFEPKSQFYLKDLEGNRPLLEISPLIKENVINNRKIKSAGFVEPVYAKPQTKTSLNTFRLEKKTDGISVMELVKNINSNGKKNEKNCKVNFTENSCPPALHYMSSPVWETRSLLQNTSTLSPPDNTVIDQKRSLGNSGLKNCSGRSFSLDIENVNTSNVSTRSFSVDFSNQEKDFQIDNEKIQKMVNEVYSKCLAMPQDSDSESIASTPDESTAKPISCKSASSEEIQRDRQQMTAERKTYLKRVCSRAKSFHRPSVGFPHLFEYVLLIGLDLNPSRCKVPYIKSKYPEDVEVPRGIEELCFPDAADWPPQACTEDGSSRCYCIVITHSSGSRKYGYCRRVQPEGAPICLPLAYCIVTPYKANYYFGQVLAELESRHGQPEQVVTAFVHQLYESPFPAPGQGLLISNPATGEKSEILIRKLDPRQEEMDIARLLNLVRFSVFIQLFSTLLLERKVILLSYSISKLSTCIEGLCASLYPFHWQHTLVPIVPSTMLDLCQAPTPYVIGLLKPRDVNSQTPVLFSTIDQVLVVDVDESKVVQSCGDESLVLPTRLCRGLREALHCAIPEKNAALSPAHNLVASEALIALFVQLVGHYRDHIITSSSTGQREFQRDGFVKSVPSNTVQNFLDWFSETTMFTAFIESRLDRSVEPWGLFEQRCVEHLAQQQAVLSKGYRANINKTVKSFGDRFKEWTS